MASVHPQSSPSAPAQHCTRRSLIHRVSFRTPTRSLSQSRSTYRDDSQSRSSYRGRSQPRSRSRGGRGTLSSNYCTCCHKRGHHVTNCWYKNPRVEHTAARTTSHTHDTEDCKARKASHRAGKTGFQPEPNHSEDRRSRHNSSP